MKYQPFFVLLVLFYIKVLDWCANFDFIKEHILRKKHGDVQPAALCEVFTKCMSLVVLNPGSNLIQEWYGTIK